MLGGQHGSEHGLDGEHEESPVGHVDGPLNATHEAPLPAQRADVHDADDQCGHEEERKQPAVHQEGPNATSRPTTVPLWNTQESEKMEE